MEHVIEQKSAPKEVTTKFGLKTTAGLKINGEWYNGFITEEKLFTINPGHSFDIELYEEEYNGKKYKKFKLPKPNLEKEIEELKREISDIKNRLSIIDGGTKNHKKVSIEDVPF